VWYRHPLAWLVEAADDICYRIIDIEDGFREGHLRYDEVHDLLWPLASPDRGFERRYASLRRERARIEYLRARAINEAVEQVFGFFVQHEADFLAGRVEAEILAQIPAAQALAALQELAVERLYFSRPVVEIAAAGYGVLGGLLEAFVAAVEDVAARGEHAHTRNRMVAHLLPEQLTGGRRWALEDPYERLLGVTDFVAGMTDSFAVSLYKMITGISLPGR
jgi:dGTPase